MPTQELPAIALLAEDASLRMGPDAARPFHYFRGLLARGLDVHLVTRELHRAELAERLPGDESRIHCVDDPSSARWLARLALLLPPGLQPWVEPWVGVVRQRARRRAVSQLVRRNGVGIVHQVTPASPRMPSRIQGLGVPIVMGPLTEVAAPPPGFRRPASRARRLLGLVERVAGFALHQLLAGRRRADVLLVANARSSRAVPQGAQGRKLRLAADALDLSEWKAQQRDIQREAIEFIAIAHLLPDCGVDLLIDAFRFVVDAVPARLRIVGEGPLRARIEARIEALDLDACVDCSGWLEPEAQRGALERADVLVYPGLRDVGAHVLMQAMSLGKPVVATDWGSAADYAGDGAGLLVGPRTRQQFTRELANVMHRLAVSVELRTELGERGLRHAQSEFDWSHRIDRLLDVYRLVQRGGARPTPPRD